VADTIVVPNVAEFKRVGNLFITWSEDADKLTELFTNIKVTPGTGAEAAALKKRFRDRLDECHDAVVAFGKALYAIGTKMVEIADKYHDTEKINAEDSKRLQDLIDAAKPYWSDIATVIPMDPYYPNYPA